MALTSNQIVTAQTLTGGDPASQLNVRAIATTATAFRIYGTLDLATATNRSLVTNQQSRIVLNLFTYQDSSLTAAEAYAQGRRQAWKMPLPWPGGLGKLIFSTPPFATCVGRVFYWFETPGNSSDTIGVLDAYELETTLACTALPI